MFFNKVIDWFFSKDKYSHWYILLFDSIIVLVAGVLAYTINNGIWALVNNWGRLLLSTLFYLPAFIVGFVLLRTHRGIIRHSTFEDLVISALSLVVGAAIVMGARIFLSADIALLPLRFRDLVLMVLVSMFFMCGWRIIIKLFYEMHVKNKRMNVYGYSNKTLLDMEMNDLLPRTPIEVDMQRIKANIEGRSIVVTGAAGSIGSELAMLLASCNPGHLLLIDQAETPMHDVRMRMQREFPQVNCTTIVANVCRYKRMEVLFKKYNPQILFHAAAYKHVPMMEDNPVEGILNNLDSTRKLADLAIKYDVEKFIMISSDKAVNPTNVMGCSKRLCEIYCHSLAKSGHCKCQFITTRFGNVLGSNGSVIPIFREQIRKGGPVRVTHPDVIRFFMLIPEACRLVLEAATIGKSGEILVFDMGNPVRIVDLAKRMIELSGRNDIAIEFTGLRPGEKLYEEVLNNEEEVLPTSNSMIKIAKVREYDYAQVYSQINDLIDTARTYDEIETVRKMKQIVPEYKSKISVYTKLDN